MFCSANRKLWERGVWSLPYPESNCVLPLLTPWTDPFCTLEVQLHRNSWATFFFLWKVLLAYRQRLWSIYSWTHPSLSSTYSSSFHFSPFFVRMYLWRSHDSLEPVCWVNKQLAQSSIRFNTRRTASYRSSAVKRPSYFVHHFYWNAIGENHEQTPYFFYRRRQPLFVRKIWLGRCRCVQVLLAI